jgi:hypothetical protein
LHHPKLLPALVIVLAVPLFAGCQTLSRQEMAWQALHAVDVAQTASAASDPCYVEDALITRQLIGANPSTEEVLLWGAGMAVGHAFVTNLLERSDAPGWMRKTWSYATITGTGLAVATNHSEGIRVFSDNKAVEGCF